MAPMASSVRSSSTAGSQMETATVPCATCRKRRVKCDKRLPGCSRCEKSNQPCPGYNRLRSFLDQGEALRQKYSEPSPKSRIRRENKLPVDQRTDQSVHEQSSTSLHGSPSLGSSADAIAQGTAKPTTSATGHFVPSFMDPAAQPDNPAQQDALSSYMSIDSLSEIEFENTFFDIDPNIYFAEGNNCCGWIPNAPLLNDLQNEQVPTISWLNQITPGNFSEPSPYPDTAMTSAAASESESDSVAGDEYETAPLVQHFSENISPYLDVFDIEKYFGHVVPVKARRSNLLTNSLAAIAAKQFAKTKRDRPAFNTPGTSNPFLDHAAADEDVDWFYKAASFYDKAICQMMTSLQGLRDGVMDAPSPAPGVLSPGDGVRGKKPAPEKVRTPASVLDDLLAAVSIFLLYESLDNRQLEINQHMSGAQFLLTKNIPGLDNFASSFQSPPLRSFDTVKAWQATFWNVVRIDYVVSYVDRTHPRINTDDIYLWQAAGLPLRVIDGTKTPESLVTGRGHPYSGSGAPMTETAACRTLLWLVLKALTYAAEERDASRTMQFTPASQGLLTTTPLADTGSWSALRDNLELWHSSLPDSFEPYLRMQPGLQRHTSQGNTPAMSEVSAAGSDSSATMIHFPTLHYSNSMASTAMILYHFTQLFLLLHKPQPTSTSSDSFPRYATKVMSSYRQVSREIDDHANKLCGVALTKGGNGNEDGCLGMHLAHPLHLAGLTLEPAAGEKKVAIEGLLKGIQKTTGCSTEWILTSLREEWGWSDVAR